MLLNLNRPVTYHYSVEVSGVHYSHTGPEANAKREKVKIDRKRVWEWRCNTGRRENRFKTRDAATLDKVNFEAAFPDVEFEVAEGSPL